MNCLKHKENIVKQYFRNLFLRIALESKKQLLFG